MRLRCLGVIWCVAGLLIAGCGGGAVNPSEAATVALIQKLGGKVETDAEKPDHSVLKVYLHNTKVQDADLASLKSLLRLQNLFLGKTGITDAGVEKLGTLTRLQTLSLNGTSVTDAGLKYLAPLSNLRTLNLQETKVTPTGIAELKRVLPTTTIAY